MQHLKSTISQVEPTYIQSYKVLSDKLQKLVHIDPQRDNEVEQPGSKSQRHHFLYDKQSLSFSFGLLSTVKTSIHVTVLTNIDLIVFQDAIKIDCDVTSPPNCSCNIDRYLSRAMTCNIWFHTEAVLITDMTHKINSSLISLGENKRIIFFLPTLHFKNFHYNNNRFL